MQKNGLFKTTKNRNFIRAERVSTKAIVPVVNELLTDVFKRNKGQVSVNQATLASWKRSFPWLSCRNSGRDYAKPLPCTFHRAIDMTSNISEALEKVISLGFQRVLTSGGDSWALEGLPVITSMIKQAAERIIIVPGGGINEKNLQRILEQSGAKEFHGSARSSVSSHMTFKKEGISMGAALSPPEFSVKVTDERKVKSLVTVASNLWGT